MAWSSFHRGTNAGTNRQQKRASEAFYYDCIACSVVRDAQNSALPSSAGFPGHPASHRSHPAPGTSRDGIVSGFGVKTCRVDAYPPILPACALVCLCFPPEPGTAIPQPASWTLIPPNHSWQMSAKPGSAWRHSCAISPARTSSPRLRARNRVQRPGWTSFSHPSQNQPPWTWRAWRRRTRCTRPGCWRLSGTLLTRWLARCAGSQATPWRGGSTRPQVTPPSISTLAAPTSPQD